MLVDAMPELNSWLLMLSDHHTLTSFWGHLSHDWLHPLTQHHDWTLMQNISGGEFKQDIGADFQKAWGNFIKSGQVWALLIGVALGYLFKQFTSFG